MLNAEQTRTLLEQTPDDGHHALWAVVLTTGLRVSEALGLRWSDINFERRQLRVIRRLRRIGGRREWSLGELKTETSRRALPLTLVTVEASKWHRTRQMVEREAAGAAYQDADLVFTGPTGNALRGDGILKYFWHPTLWRLGLPHVTLRGGRHTAATLMRESGMDLKVVQETLGIRA